MNEPDLVQQIITSPEARKFLQMVTKDFYGNSYMGLWIFEVIGREWDEMREWTEGLKDEIFPQTCTWTIAIWEWLYGIEPDDSLSLEFRRQRILSRVVDVRPVNPEAIRRAVVTLLRVPDESVEVEDFSGPYRFTVVLHPQGTLFPYHRVEKLIYDIKPSHLAFDTVIETKVMISVLIGRDWYLYYPGMTNQYPAGTKPQVNVKADLNNTDISVITGSIGANIPLESAGTVFATAPGTDIQRMPSPSHTFSQDAASIYVSPSGDGHQILTPDTDDDRRTGQYPDANVKLRLEDAGITIEPEEAAANIPAVSSGTVPDVQHTFSQSRSDISVSSGSGKYSVTADHAGTKPQTNFAGGIRNISIDAQSGGNKYAVKTRRTEDDLKAGTAPDVQHHYQHEETDVWASADGAGCSVPEGDPAGTKPQTMKQFRAESVDITPDADGAGYKHSPEAVKEDARTGTKPDTNMSGQKPSGGISPVIEGKSYSVKYPMCGTGTTKSE